MAEQKAEKEKVTLVVFSDALDRAFAALGFGVIAASMGMEVSVVFTFWGLNIIKKDGGGIKSKGLMRKMLNRINRGGSKRLKFSKFNMFGLGTWLMKRLMKETKMPSVDNLIALAHQMGVKLIACTSSREFMGADKDPFRSEVTDVVGTATWLGKACQSKVTLFI
mgnify:CR=1 FL=1